VGLVRSLSWALLASCAPAPVASRNAATPARASLAASLPEAPVSAPAARRATLRFELSGRRFPLPLIHGSVGGEPVWMLVDTGANSHVIASWVVRKLGVAMRPLGEVGSDHTGRAVTTYAVDAVRVVIDGWGPLAEAPAVVTDVPDPIARIGIGAFVSPQWLAHEGDALVLDLARGEMHDARWDEASRELDGLSGRDIDSSGVRLCRDSASSIPGLAFVLAAQVEDHAVDLLLDTGAYRTDLLSGSPAARALATRARPSTEQMYAASGLVRANVVRSARVRVGEWLLTTDVDVVPGVSDPACPRDGVVSMDVLASCTLLLGRTRLRGRCGF
jgi:predicted aspartyl protease